MYKPQYTITNKILENVSEIEAANQIILNINLLSDWEEKLQKVAIIKRIKHEGALSGVKLSKKLIKQFLNKMENEEGKIRNIQEIINFKKANEFIKQNKDKELKENIIHELHRIIVQNILPKEIAGNLRLEDAEIYDLKFRQLEYETVDPGQLPIELKDLIRWYNNSKVNEILKAGIVQYEIMRIHPYYDANGRVGRMLCTWCLYSSGYDAKEFYSLEEHYDKDLIGYYKALSTADEGDLTIWLEYFTEGLKEEFERLKNKVLQIFRGELKLDIETRFPKRQKKILDFVRKNKEIRRKDYIKLFPDLSDDTVLREIQRLRKLGYIRKVGKTKGTKYVLDTY
ncbi:hypothetical protein GF362_01365 [Candidatus Dojkabacteria bacterium]|nr:hypothetical protein [Candidatus Dojkabacteria bacterium]